MIGLGLLNLIVLYFRGFFRDRRFYQIFNLSHLTGESLIAAVAGLTDSFLEQGKITGFWVGAEAIFSARLVAIQSAQISIEFETYIMTPGRRADCFAVALSERARAGVKIRLIVDSFGAKSIAVSYWRNLQDLGIEVQIFNRFSWRDPLSFLNETIASCC